MQQHIIDAMNDQPSQKKQKISQNVVQHVLDTPEIRAQIFAFLRTNSDLCALDLVNRSFRQSTEPHWDALVVKRFGVGSVYVGTGKERWRKAVSFFGTVRVVYRPKTPLPATIT